MPIPPQHPQLDAFIATLSPANQALLEEQWADILTHDDVGGKNADYARRARLMEAAKALGFRGLTR
jgi:hypothetical protein